MAGPFRTQDFELFVQAEASYGVSPGALAATDAFKCSAQNPFKRNIARYDRDKDQGNQASVLSTQKGRESLSWTVTGDVIPSNNASTPTAPDMDPFFEAHFGAKHTGTAHTTLAAGSTASVLELTPGGGAASGIAVGDLIAVDVSATFGLEVRQVTIKATDTITLDRALSAAPAAARAVYLGTTYTLTFANLKSVHLWQYLNGDNFRQKAGGCDVRQMEIGVDFSAAAPVASVTFNGEGIKVETHATAKPTPTTAGEPLIPPEIKAWIGTTEHCVVKANLSSNNGIEQRINTSCSLFPEGLKRTGNAGRYSVSQSIDLLLTTGTVEGYYDAADALTAYDVLVQMGNAVGNIVAWRTPKFIVDDPAPGEADGEVTLPLSGKCYGLTSVDTEVKLAFI